MPVVIDTRSDFRPLAVEFGGVLSTLGPEDWSRPTLAGTWRVRDVLAHLVDTAFRRVSSVRDGCRPPIERVDDERALLSLVNRLNAEWIQASQRLSPRVLIDLYTRAAAQLADVMEALALDGPALIPVSWAGEDGNQAWLDIGREFTEQWHHQMQIRDAVGASPPDNPLWLKSVLAIAMCGLPHAYRHVDAAPETEVGISVTGPSGADWRLVRSAERWRIEQGTPRHPTTIVTLSDDAAWRLLFNALPSSAAPWDVRGEERFAAPLLHARSVIV